MEIFKCCVYFVLIVFTTVVIGGHEADWITADGLENEICQEDLKLILKLRYMNQTINETGDNFEYPGDVVVGSRFNVGDDTVNCFGFEKLGIRLNWLLSNLKPASSDSVNTHFYISSRKNPSRIQVQRNGYEFNMKEVDFDSKRKTVFIIHGFMSNSNASWVKDMTQAFLNWEDVNVIAVDWSGGGSTLMYWKAAANTRRAGCDISRFMKQLTLKTGASIKDVHCVGHSLGAHICSYASFNLGGFSRITGLDPAQPCFQTRDTSEYLDPTDADFVDVIHTNGRLLSNLGLGMPKPSGHADFYPNGGMKQPGCTSSSFLGAVTSILPISADDIQQAICSHGRSYTLLTESLNSNECYFKASSWNLSLEGAYHSLKSDACSDNTVCAEMGIAAAGGQRFPRAKGTYVLLTRDAAPFCCDQVEHNQLLPSLLEDLVQGFQIDKIKRGNYRLSFVDDGTKSQPGFKCILDPKEIKKLPNSANSNLSTRLVEIILLVLQYPFRSLLNYI